MSISTLPVNPMQMQMQMQQPQLPTPTPAVSAAVTRILTLSSFSDKLKTRDLQQAFAGWETEKGGFKIKWIDDVTALVVFADATVGELALYSSI